MAMNIESWLDRAESRLSTGVGISTEDLQELRTLIHGAQQHLLYIWANADLITADVISWNYFGPFESEGVFDPKNECPYKNVKEAMVDGWRVISFPDIEYPVDNAHTHLGHEFIMERFFAPGDGLEHTPHGKRT
jgi:hypothetical protein